MVLSIDMNRERELITVHHTTHTSINVESLAILLGCKQVDSSVWGLKHIGVCVCVCVCVCVYVCVCPQTSV